MIICELAKPAIELLSYLVNNKKEVLLSPNKLRKNTKENSLMHKFKKRIAIKTESTLSRPRNIF